jgi:hypothetical protein
VIDRSRGTRKCKSCKKIIKKYLYYIISDGLVDRGSNICKVITKNNMNGKNDSIKKTPVQKLASD